MPTSLAVAAIGAGISAGANKLLSGGGGGGAAFAGANLGGPAGQLRLRETSSSFKRSSITNDLLAGIRGTSAQAVTDINDLIGRVRPGFSEFRNAGLGAIENARSRSVSDLRGNLNRRRLLGSSFANDTIARTEREFAAEKAEFAAASTLQELDATLQLLNTRTNTALQAITLELDQGNFELGLATSAFSGVQAAVSSAAQAQAQLAAANAAGIGEFLGFSVGDSLQTGITDFLGGFSSSGGGRV